MTLQISETKAILVEGYSHTAGAEIHVRDARMFVIDGILAGSAGDRIFVTDVPTALVQGGRPSQQRMALYHDKVYVVTGAGDDLVSIRQDTAFEIHGVPTVNRIASRRAVAYIIEDTP